MPADENKFMYTGALPIETRLISERVDQAAASMVWMANTIHTAHHDHDVEWRKCRRGVCASMEHMLGHLGYDKDLNPIPVIP